MADRLEGLKLRAVRALVERPLTRKVLWKAVAEDFGLSLMQALPASELGPVEQVPKPVQGRAPRQWGGEPLDPPTSHRTTAADLRRAYTDGRTSPVEVLDRILDVEARHVFGDATNSPFITLDPEIARDAAKASAARWAEGKPTGPLDGVPVPVKDQYTLKGLPSYGGTAWRTRRFREDAVVVQQLRQGGAVIPGTTHVTENGLNPLGFNPNHAMPRNVYSAEHGAGGSSTGSAVAVGLGLAPVAVGTDGGGSIRTPAALNGLFGLKPTFNRLSSTGNLWKGSVGHAGPIGASVEDLVDLLEVASSFDPDDPFTGFATDWESVRPHWRAALGRGIAGCRLGVLHREIAEADPRIAALTRDALAALEAEGAELVDVHLDHIEVANAIGPLIIASESAANAATDMAIHRRESSDELRLVYGLMQAVDAPTYLLARRVRAGLRLRVAELLAGVDLLVLPTVQRPAAPYPVGNGRQIADLAWTGAMTRFAFLGNLTGLPALTAPIGMVNDLPVGLQFLGDAWDEASCLAAGAHVERMGLSHLPRPRGYVDLLG